MKLPFTADQFLEVFRYYNQSIFPLQILFYFLAIAAIFLSIKKIAFADRLINAILSFFWIWMGLIYHFKFFSSINKAAWLFGSLFVLQGSLFLYFGVIKQKLTYRFRPDGSGFIGATFVAFALVPYPLLGYLFGHVYPASPTFGLPCPTTIFSFGMLLWCRGKCPWTIVIIPFIWSLIGFSAAIRLGMREDTALPIAGITTILILWFQKQKPSPSHSGR
jgi:hypothetical protein